LKFLPAVQSGFRNYVNFEARACRSELWYFVLFTLIGVIATSVIAASSVHLSYTNDLFALVTMPPGLALAVRRTHDLNWRGWLVWVLWILMMATPIPRLLIGPNHLLDALTFAAMVALFVGAFILLIAWCQRGTVGPNRFGPDRLAELVQQPRPEQDANGTPSIQPTRRWWEKWWLAVIVWSIVIIWYAGFHAAIFHMLAQSDAYRLGVSVAQNSPVVASRLGTPVAVGTPDAGSVSNALTTNSGAAALSFPVRGPKGSGHIILQAAENEGVWRLTNIQLHLDGEAQR
jgi:uncharacterized membrane protein YhaH (DUF805 family)